MLIECHGRKEYTQPRRECSLISKRGEYLKLCGLACDFPCGSSGGFTLRAMSVFIAFIVIFASSVNQSNLTPAVGVNDQQLAVTQGVNRSDLNACSECDVIGSPFGRINSVAPISVLVFPKI